MSIADERNSIAAAYEDETVVLGYLENRQRYAWQRLLHARQCALLNGWLRRSGARRVLEVAPGPARLSVALDGVSSGIMVENSQEMVAVARKRLRDAGLSDNWRVLHGDAFGLGALLAGQQFEFAYTFRFLRHFRDAERGRLYGELRDRLAPGGVLAFDVVNAVELRRIESRAVVKSASEIDIYDVAYTPESFRAEMAGAGFEVVELVPVVGRFALQGALSYRLERWAPTIADALVHGIERIPARQPLEWVALCRKPG
jgi:SAM-dependent methyltransferase